MTKELEFKAVPTEFKAADGDEGEYEGHFAIFGNVDDGKDISEPGMFVKTLKENGHRVKVFFAHDWMKPIGPTPKKLLEDAAGLLAKGRLTLKSFWGNEAWQLMKDGAITEGSFGYNAVKFDFDDDGNRHLREVKLFEISPVPLGMNALTEIRAMKSALYGTTLAAHPGEQVVKVSAVKWLPMWFAEEKNAETLKRTHAYFDTNGDPTDFRSYLYPHHDTSGDLSVEGLLTAGATFHAGKVEHPKAAHDLIREHLNIHFKQINRQPPWAKQAFTDKIETLAALMQELKDGEALVTADRDRVTEVLNSLDALVTDARGVIAADEPTDSGHLTLLETRLRAAELALDIQNSN